MFNPRRGFGLASPQFWIGVAITSFFLLMIVLFWRREASRDVTVRRLGVEPDFLTATWENYESWMWIVSGEQALGAYTMNVYQLPDASFELIARSRMNLNVLGRAQPLAMDLAVEMDKRFELETFQGRLKVAGQEIRAEAFVEEMSLYFALRGPELLVPPGGIHRRIALQEPVMLADAVQPVVTRQHELEVGKRWTTRASDPIFGRFDMPVTIEVEAREPIEFGGRTIMAWRVVERSEALTSTSWYDREGRLLKTELDNGLTMILADKTKVVERFPSIRAPMRLGAIDREAIREKARQAEDAPQPDGEGLLPWLPAM